MSQGGCGLGKDLEMTCDILTFRLIMLRMKLLLYSEFLRTGTALQSYKQGTARQNRERRNIWQQENFLLVFRDLKN